MSEYSVDIGFGSQYLHIRREGADEVPWYLTESYAYECGYFEEDPSCVIITTDIRTTEILDISYTGSFCGGYRVHSIWDSDEFDAEEKKPKASFIGPGVDDPDLDLDPDRMRGFTFYYAKDCMVMILEDGEAYYRYHDDRLTMYYDKDYILLKFYVNDVTEEEFGRMMAQRERSRRSF